MAKKRLTDNDLEGKGNDWSLAANPLRLELLQLEQFMEVRKRR